MQCTPHLYFYRGEQDYEGKTAFLQVVPQSSINTEPNAAFANRRLLSIKVCKKADFGIYSFDRTRDGGLGVFLQYVKSACYTRDLCIHPSHTKLKTLSLAARQAIKRKPVFTMDIFFFSYCTMRNVEEWAKR